MFCIVSYLHLYHYVYMIILTLNIFAVTEFSKKSGDYTSLSATDIKVIALTYQLEKEKVGTAHLKDAPTIRTIASTKDKPSGDDLKLPIGFYMPKNTVRYFLYIHKFMYIHIYNVTIFSITMFFIQEKNELDADNEETSLNNVEKTDEKEENFTHREITEKSAINDASSDESDYETATSDFEDKTEDVTEKFAELKCNPTDLEVDGEGERAVDDILAPIDTISEDENSDVKYIEDDDDDSGWITPGKSKIIN